MPLRRGKLVVSISRLQFLHINTLRKPARLFAYTNSLLVWSCWQFVVLNFENVAFEYSKYDPLIYNDTLRVGHLFYHCCIDTYYTKICHNVKIVHLLMRVCLCQSRYILNFFRIALLNLWRLHPNPSVQCIVLHCSATKSCCDEKKPFSSSFVASSVVAHASTKKFGQPNIPGSDWSRSKTTRTGSGSGQSRFSFSRVTVS